MMFGSTNPKLLLFLMVFPSCTPVDFKSQGSRARQVWIKCEFSSSIRHMLFFPTPCSAFGILNSLQPCFSSPAVCILEYEGDRLFLFKALENCQKVFHILLTSFKKPHPERGSVLRLLSHSEGNSVGCQEPFLVLHLCFTGSTGSLGDHGILLTKQMPFFSQDSEQTG